MRIHVEHVVNRQDVRCVQCLFKLLILCGLNSPSLVHLSVCKSVSQSIDLLSLSRFAMLYIIILLLTSPPLNIITFLFLIMGCCPPSFGRTLKPVDCLFLYFARNCFRYSNTSNFEFYLMLKLFRIN